MKIHIDPQFETTTYIILDDQEGDDQCRFNASTFEDGDEVMVEIQSPEGEVAINVKPEEAVEMARALLRAVGKEHWLVDDEMSDTTFLAKIGEA